MNYVVKGERTVAYPRTELYELLRARIDNRPRDPADPVIYTPYDSIELDWRSPTPPAGATPAEATPPAGPFGDSGRLHLAFSSASGGTTQIQLRMTAGVSILWWLALKLFGKGAGLDGGLMIDDLLRGTGVTGKPPVRGRH